MSWTKPAVFAQAAVLGIEIVDRKLPHLGHDRPGFVRAGGGDGFEIVTDSGIDARLRHGRHPSVPGKEALRPGPAVLVAVPVEGGGEFQPLRGLQPHTVHVGNEDEQRHDGLTAARQPELARLFDGVDHVAAAIGERDDFRARGLRLQQVGTEIGGIERVADAAEHFSAGRKHRAGRIGFERMAERIVDGEEKPGIAALGDDRAGEARGQRIAVIDPRRLGWRACFAGEGRAADGAGNGDPVVLGRKLLDGERDRRIVKADRHVDFFRVEPAPRNRRADVGLVLVIGNDDLDRLAEHRAANIFDRHARGDDRARAAQVGVEAGLVVEHADADDVVRDLAACARSADGRCRKNSGQRDWKSQHDLLPYTHWRRSKTGRSCYSGLLTVNVRSASMRSWYQICSVQTPGTISQALSKP